MAVVINPVSGADGDAAAGRRRAELAARLLSARDIEPEIFLTERPGHATDLARGAVQRGAALVIAWGGDGTLNEVATALIGGSVPMGIVRAGSGNGLAREMGIPRDPATAIARAVSGRDRRIDVGELGGRVFLNVAGTGVDATVAARFAARSGRRGFVPYAVISLNTLWRCQAQDYTLTIDGTVVTARALLVTLANSRQYGNGAVIAPGARIDDGQLDLVWFGDLGRMERFWEARRLFTGSVGRGRGSHVCRFRELTMASDQPMPFHVDGEPIAGRTRLEARVHPAALVIRS